MSVSGRAYIDTSALAKWYLNEANSATFVRFLSSVDAAVISSLTHTEMRSLLSRRRRMGELTVAIESLLFSAFVEDIDRGWLQFYALENERFAEATNLLARYPEQSLRTLDALHLVQAAHCDVDLVATADQVMAAVAEAMNFEVVYF